MDILLLFVAISSQNHLPPNLLSSLCYIESHHKPDAIHKDDGPGGDSLGICQIKLSTAREMGFKGSAKQLMSPSTNIKYAAKFLKYQLKRYGNNTERAVIAYNRGNARGLTSTNYQRKVYKQWGKK